MADNTYSFGDALEFMKQGKAVSRTAWNASKMRAELHEMPIVSLKIFIILCDNNPIAWQPMTQDILAEDWYVVE